MGVARADLRRVAKCAEELAEARANLRDSILDAVKSGETYRDVAEAAGMSHQRVWKIVQEHNGKDDKD